MGSSTVAVVGSGAVVDVDGLFTFKCLPVSSVSMGATSKVPVISVDWTFVCTAPSPVMILAEYLQVPISSGVKSTRQPFPFEALMLPWTTCNFPLLGWANKTSRRTFSSSSSSGPLKLKLSL